MVIVGTPGGILIPELPRGRGATGAPEGDSAPPPGARLRPHRPGRPSARAAVRSAPASRLRGLRLLHTHLSPEGLTEEDLMDLLFLRLDAVIALSVNPEGEPVRWQAATLAPGGAAAPGAPPCQVDEPRPWDRTAGDFAARAAEIEAALSALPAAPPSGPGAGFDAGADAGEGAGAPCAGRALLVSVAPEPRAVQEQRLSELAELARTAGLAVCGRLIQRVARPDPHSILGKGKLAELEVMALRENADILVFDGELSPAQIHNLADITERKVIDRTQLILDIFAQHAASRAGRLQVELAQLRYMLPRLAGRNRALDRLMGGVGGRGPGESRLETDRRKVRERMTRLARELEKLRRQRGLARRGRRGIPQAALVGYTNAGKSTLLNTLTRSRVLAENRLFATLDPATRRLRVPGEREVVIADTVGFIRNLPRELMDAFRATLEELAAADFLVHVADASHPDLLQQIASVETILEELGLHAVPRVLALNKWDRLPEPAREELRAAFPGAIPLSARNGEGLDALLRWLERQLALKRAMPAQADTLAGEEVEGEEDAAPGPQPLFPLQ
ncbi:GTPase HflX [Desulfovibrio sp. ZJ209]|uniref:GTPase HflX n=2 Tax=unclassified Desulfovibrio TaxID=2593640 RepID=UPI0013ECFD64